jgi:hypothetical protein
VRGPIREVRSEFFEERLRYCQVRHCSKTEAPCNLRQSVVGPEPHHPRPIRCAAHHQLRSRAISLGRQNRRYSRRSAPAARIYVHRSVGCGYDSKEPFLHLFDRREVALRFGLICDPGLALPCPLTRNDASRRSDLSPQERGEVEHQFNPPTPASASPARYRETRSSPACFRRCRDDRAEHLSARRADRW